FHLYRTNAIARGVDDVVTTPLVVDVAILIHMRVVAGDEPTFSVGFDITLGASFLISIVAEHDLRVRRFDGQTAGFTSRQQLIPIINNGRFHAGQGPPH